MKILSLRRLAFESVWYHRRSALQVALGTAVAVAILTGALIVGDSVRFSLKRFAMLRLGRTEFAMPLAHRFADASLADDIAKAAGKGGPSVLPVLRLPAMAMVDEEGDRARQINRVNVLGVTGPFVSLGSGDSVHPSGQEAALGGRLAAALGVREGDTIAVRIAKPSLLPRQAPLASRKDRLAVRADLKVVKVLSDEAMGRFSLDANQVAPYNIFVDLEWLQERVDLQGKANLFLVSESGDGPGGRDMGAVLRSVWTPETAGMAWKTNAGVAQLVSDRVYIDPPVAAALSVPHVSTLTYLVSGIATTDGTRRIPYSFAVACSPTPDRALGPVPEDMRDDEVLVNAWVAGKLGLAAGSRLRIEYQAMLDSDRFDARSREFTVKAVLPMPALAGEAALVPRFPGLTDVNSCKDWDIGMPMDESDLKNADNEAYWNEYRTTPKVFLTLAAGRAMWANRFGDTTGIRIPGGDAGFEKARTALRAGVNPAALGFVFLPVRQQASAAVEQGMDFGELFLGMSFFLIIAALLLTGMLFAFSVEQRSEEMGVLSAQGFRAAHLRRMLMTEGVLLAAAGSLIGVFAATLYTKALIYGLGRYWRDAVAGSAIHYHSEWGTYAAGAVSGIVCAVVTLLVAVWRQTRRPARELLELDLTQSSDTVATSRPGWIAWALAAGGGAIAVALAAWGALARPDGAVEIFFSAGGLLLVAGLAWVRIALYAVDGASQHLPGLAALGRRNAARRVGRSLAVAALLACGTFLVFAVSSMKQDVVSTAHRRDSGTGGFALFAESSFDLPDDLNSVKGRKLLIPKPEEWPAGMEIVPVKVREGDDASCLNLNRAQSPRLLGVNPSEMSRRGAFCRGNDAGLWRLLDSPGPAGTVPALIGDDNTAKYGLGKKAGDVLLFNDERGNEFKVTIVGVLPHHISVFQGALLIPMTAFHEKYPSTGGARMFLIDLGGTPAGDPRVVAAARRLTAAGLDVVPSSSRLAMFYSVEETYLQMFLVLGGLGMLLGSIGLGVMVMRNVLERRGELAMLLCVGFTRRMVASMVVSEHLLLLLGGTAVGVVASAVAIWPTVSAPGATVPFALLAALLAGMLAAGFCWIVLASRVAMKGRLIEAVRSE